MVSSQKGDKPKRELETTRKLRGAPLSDRLRAGHSPISDFDQFDLIIECVAGYVDRGEVVEDDDKVHLRGMTVWDPICANRRQHQLLLEAERHQETGLPVRAATEVASLRDGIVASSSELDAAGGGQNELFEALLGVVALAMGETSDDKRFVVRAVSCGVRPGGASPNGELNALFVVYRKLKLELVFEVPAARERRRVRGSTNVDLGGGGGPVTHDTTTTVDRYGRTLGPSQPRTGVQVTETRIATVGTVGHRDLAGVARAPELASSQVPDVVRLDSASFGEGFKFSIKINGRELDLSARVRRLLRAKERFEDLLDAFADLIARAPQIGWRFEYEVKVLFGAIRLVYERDEETEIVDDRLVRAAKRLSVRGELTLLKAKAELSFGVDQDVRVGQATARVLVKLEGEVKTTVDLRLPGGTAKWEVEGTIPAEVSGVGAVSARFVGSVSVTVRAATGLKVTATFFDATPPRPGAPPSRGPWKLDAKVKRMPCVVSIAAEAGLFRRAFSRELWGERQLWPSEARP